MLNWLTRYAFLWTELEFDNEGRLRESVLDVGCGPHGLSTLAPDAVFAGVDLAFPAPLATGLIGFRNEPGRLPFEDGSFDTVLCIDVLEHVPPPAREAFVRELARVCARRTFLACPSDEADWAEVLIRGQFAARGMTDVEWLNEHAEYGLPSSADIRTLCSSLEGFQSHEVAMTGSLLSTLAVIADVLPELADRAAAESREHRTEWRDVFNAGRFGPAYRKGYEIERTDVLHARVDAARFERTIWHAVRCPACGTAACEPGPVGVACAACGHLVSQDDSGAWDLTSHVSSLDAPRAGGAQRMKPGRLLRMLRGPASRRR